MLEHLSQFLFIYFFITSGLLLILNLKLIFWGRSVFVSMSVFLFDFSEPKNRFTRYPAWNSKMYPVWKDGDPRYKDSWKGGKVTFNVGNDSPTLTGAKVTFTIDLEFPHNQKVQPDGDVVWAEDLSLDLTGQYWQVADGPSSSLTIGTDDIPLGSYTMDIVIYHYRSKEKFIPLGYASTQFSITDQIPFAVSLDQVNDIVAGDMRFIQNRAIAFSITLHDPSEYLSNADITFNWDFGDESGALISRELTVTHTYISSGSFRPQVVIQAVIPDKACDPPVDPTRPPPPPPPTLTLRGRASVLLVSKREAKDKPSDDDCVIYRYGSFCTGIEVFEGIETVQITQMDNAVVESPETVQSVVDITVTCRGSRPREVCSVILDAECLRPIHTVCNMVEPSKECQMVLRHFFNDSGTYCINVSMANDVSLAATSAKLNLEMGTHKTSHTTARLTNRQLVWLNSSSAPSGPSAVSSSGTVAMFSSRSSIIWNLLNRRGAVDNCPLLQDRPL
uniref:Premelanosome protein b n=1 Tax=Echeneis naucrates TaxID=173247 RepID=A0A665V6T7_ECHNA